MSTSDAEKIKARARLALRAERAFGLGTLPARISAGVSPAAHAGAAVADPSANDSGPGPRRDFVQRRSDAETPLKPALAAGATEATAPASASLFGKTSGSTAAVPASSRSAGLRPTLLTSEPFTAPPLPHEQKIIRLKALDENEVRGCTKCRLCKMRTHTVFGEGDPDSMIFFIGEGPGENEDQQGRPFVGRAGELLGKWIAAMGLKREQVYIANIVKCRPPGNREPASDEVATCTPYLERQLEIIRPQVIMTLGRPASQHMLQTRNSMGRMRGQWYEWRGIRLMPTYHPAYVLRNYTYETRAAVWGDLQQVMQALGMPLPKRGGGEQS